jgi:chorismate mutase
MSIDELRGQITALDETILECFLKRMQLSEAIADYKRANKLPLVDEARERAILEKVREDSGAYGHFAEKLFCTLFELSKARQSELL